MTSHDTFDVDEELTAPELAPEQIEQALRDANPTQEFGEDPLGLRDTGHYTAEYNEGFVDKWDELIDWKGRYESEGRFFIDLLKARGVRSVLDVATGTGFHSVRLHEEGFQTVSADGSAEMLAKAFENGRAYGGHLLQVVHADWRWLNKDVHGKFDAVICLGNSFTHMFSERDRRKALAEFCAALKHDGILIVDQRNYDAMLDTGFSSKHAYYYCGEEVVAEPEYLDEGLARFRYKFPDESQFHLNMYPLRKDYMRRLLREVGFQRIDTYGDFQSTYADDEPDFLVHVAEKLYREEASAVDNYSQAVQTARNYYNSTDADTFYHSIWGGEDIHVGLYGGEEDTIGAASVRTVARMAEQVHLDSNTKVLDVGAGFGGAARYLARSYGCTVTCLNLSEVENERNRAKSAEQNLAHLVEVTDGSFEELPFPDDSFDVVWSQDALLHSGDRIRALAEIARVLRSGGELVFTDPMAADNCSREALRPVLERLDLDSMGSPGFYRKELGRLGIGQISYEDHAHQLTTHYGRVLAELQARESEIADKVSDEYRTHMKEGLQNWVNAGSSDNLAWGIFHARA
jgi:sarcosine/dimethylglycine N-methyltransferase